MRRQFVAARQKLSLEFGWFQSGKRVRASPAARLSAAGPQLLCAFDTEQLAHWPFMRMAPEERVRAAGELGAKAMLPVHVGRFSNPSHAWDEPFIRAAKAGRGKTRACSRRKLATPRDLTARTAAGGRRSNDGLRLGGWSAVWHGKTVASQSGMRGNILWNKRKQGWMKHGKGERVFHGLPHQGLW